MNDAALPSDGSVLAITPRPPAAKSSAAALAPLIAMLFVAYLVIGLALPVLPLHVHEALGLGTFAVGLVSGSQFGAALLSRMAAGRFTDRRGPKRAVATGLLIMVVAGLFYLLSLRFVDAPMTSVSVLLLGRALLGIGESFLITGTLGWGLALLGPESTGKAMSWLGTALYAAFAIGAPLGTSLYTEYGFTAIALAATFIPLGALLLVTVIRPVAPNPPAPAGLARVLKAVWIPGVALALSGVGFSAVTTFIGLLFVARGWGPVWVAFTALSVAFIAGRALLGHLPDKLGGTKVALVCVMVEALGQTFIWLASSPALALAGLILTGLGYSLVYPGLGVEAVRAAPPQSRALAMGAYTAFLDLSLGISAPALGWVANGQGLRAVYLVSMLVVLCSTAIALRMLKRTAPPVHSSEHFQLDNIRNKHGIVADIEVIPIQKIDEAYDRMQRNNVKYCFVIDISSLGA